MTELISVLKQIVRQLEQIGTSLDILASDHTVSGLFGEIKKKDEARKRKGKE